MRRGYALSIIGAIFGIGALFAPWLMVSKSGSDSASIGLSPFDVLWGYVAHPPSVSSIAGAGGTGTAIQGNLVATLGIGGSVLVVGGLLVVSGSILSLISFRWPKCVRVGGPVMLMGLIVGSIGWLISPNRAEIAGEILAIGPNFGQGLAGVGTVLTIAGNFTRVRTYGMTAAP